MADSSRLSATHPISNPSNSSQHSSLMSTISSGSDDGLKKSGILPCSTWIGPSQVSYQHTSNHQSSTSIDLRLPSSFHDNSDTEDAHSPSIDDPGKSMTITPKGPMRKCRENSGFNRQYCRIIKRPQGLKIFQPGKIFNSLPGHQRLRPEITSEAPTSMNILQLWKWELLSCFIAVGMLGSMYGILLRYDGQRTPEWGSGINLSTLIALIATLLRTMLVFVVAEIIGQAKWQYFFGDERPTEDPPMRLLIETSRFNDASHGLLGAMKLLPTIIQDPATLLAVTVMTVSLATGSFVQQAIQTQSCQFPVDSVNASLPICRSATSGESRPVEGPKIIAALMSAFAPENEELESPISVGCSTGNCTFQNSIDGLYSTVGVCSSCIDVSSLITVSISQGSYPSYAIVTNYTLPNGMSVEAGHEYNDTGYWPTTELSISASSDLGVVWAGDLVSPKLKALSRWALVNVTILSSTILPNSLHSDGVAATCTLYPCLRSYKASMTSGRLDEVLVSTVPLVPDVLSLFAPNTTSQVIQELSPDVWDSVPQLFSFFGGAYFRAIQSPCLVNDTIWTKANQSYNFDTQHLMLLHADPDHSEAGLFTVENATVPEKCVYGLKGSLGIDFGALLSGILFNGRCSGSAFTSDRNETYMDINCAEAYWLSTFYVDGLTTADIIIRRIEAFTERLSNKLRMGLLSNLEAVSGQVLQASVCSRIYYSWLTFPAVLVAITSGLLAWTIFQNSRRRGRTMVWKTSILPFLFYGDRFVLQNGENMSTDSAEPSREDEAMEPLLSLDQMEGEARQRKVRFDVS